MTNADTAPCVETVAAQFAPIAGADVVRAEAYGAGNINDTFLIESSTGHLFILQRINQRVFRDPRKIMENLRTINEHITSQTTCLDVDSFSERRWELPKIVEARDGGDYAIDDQGGFWRALTFIDGARTYPMVQDAHHAGEAGYALGRFQREISDLNVARLYDTLPGFHIISHYLNHYDEVLRTSNFDLRVPEIRHGMACIAQRRDWALVLQGAAAAGYLQERPIHGDPKIDNIMIDDISGAAVSVIDLDTVKPGLVQYDIGDCLRSSCNPLGEETFEVDHIRFELDLCEVILKGYLPEVSCFYSNADYAYLYDAVCVLAFEMGLRFFTDYLEGNVYFKTHYPEHNLMRTLVQFKLMQDIEVKEAQVRGMIASLAAPARGALQKG